MGHIKFKEHVSFSQNVMKNVPRFVAMFEVLPIYAVTYGLLQIGGLGTGLEYQLL